MGSPMMLGGQNLMQVGACVPPSPDTWVWGWGRRGVFPAPLARTGPFMVHCCPLLAMCGIFSGLQTSKLRVCRVLQELAVGATDYARVTDCWCPAGWEHPASKLSSSRLGTSCSSAKKGSCASKEHIFGAPLCAIACKLVTKMTSLQMKLRPERSGLTRVSILLIPRILPEMYGLLLVTTMTRDTPLALVGRARHIKHLKCVGQSCPVMNHLSENVNAACTRKQHAPSFKSWSSYFLFLPHWPGAMPPQRSDMREWTQEVSMGAIEEEKSGLF